VLQSRRRGGEHRGTQKAVAPGAIDTPVLEPSLDEMGLDRHESAKKDGGNTGTM
jgi:hypothetical protein